MTPGPLPATRLARLVAGAFLGPFLGSILFLPAAAAPAQPPAPPSAGGQGPGEGAVPEELFAETVDVQVVNVEVRVTDRKGRPVTGLTREDFELYEDGRRVEIRHFAPVGFDQAAAGRSGETVATPADGGEAPEIPYLVVFLDRLHRSSSGWDRALGDLEGFLRDDLHPGTEVMVASFDGSFRVVEEFTRDRDRAAAAIRAEDRAPSLGLHERVGERNTVTWLQQLLAASAGVCDDPCQCAMPEMLAAVASYGGRVEGHALDTVQGLELLTSSLATLPGDKAVVVVTDGLQHRPAVGLYSLILDLCPGYEHEVMPHIQSNDLSKAYLDLSAEAAASRVTLYTLQARGLQASFDPSSPASPLTERAARTNLQYPLHLIADETGGRAILNTGRFDQELDRIAGDLSAYYSLGFVPDHQGDGRIHRLRVEVAGRHRVRYRQSYRDRPFEERLAQRLLGTLLYGVEENPLGVEVTLADAGPPGADRLDLPIRIRVPLERVATTPGAGFSVGRLRLILVARGPEGEWTPVKQHEALFKLPEGEDRADAVRQFEVAVDLLPGENTVAVGVRDEVGGESSYLRKTFQVEDRRQVSGTD